MKSVQSEAKPSKIYRIIHMVSTVFKKTKHMWKTRDWKQIHVKPQFYMTGGTMGKC